MTSRGPRKPVDAAHARGRLLQAREFHESGRSLVTLAQGGSCNGAVALMVMATIAYADAITARTSGIVNQQDHQGAPRRLREVLAADCRTSRGGSFASCWAARTKSTTAHAAQRSTKHNDCSWSWMTSRRGPRARSDQRLRQSEVRCAAVPRAPRGSAFAARPMPASDTEKGEAGEQQRPCLRLGDGRKRLVPVGARL